MAHPYRSAGRDGAKTKFRSMLGTTNGAKHVNDDSVVSASTPVKKGIEDVKILAKSAPKRLDRARGGQVKKGVTVNVIVPQAQDKPPMPMPMPMPPPGPPPGAMMGKPPMGPPGPGAGPPMPTPGAGLPMQKARGGAVERAGGGRATMPVQSDRARKTRDRFQSRIDAMDSPIKDLAPTAVDPAWVPKARGGYIGGESKSSKLKQWAQYARKNSYHKKDGGGITKAKLTAGADSGVGRLQHSKAQRKHMKDN